jgi:hypothetical protein
MKIIFLDIDGVLNGHEWFPGSQSTGIKKESVDQLNRILKDTEAKLVISSAWRYLIHNGAMNKRGFEIMLRTHGLIVHEVYDVTIKDEDTPGYNKDDMSQWIRGEQIKIWLQKHPEIETFVVLDDIEIKIPEIEGRFIKTKEKIGLTKIEADQAIKILNSKKHSAKEEN